MKHIANMMTCVRMVGSVLLLFCPVFGPLFWTLYVLCGVSDMLDGFVARRLHVESRHGAVLDSVADAVFLAVCFVRILPEITLPPWIWCWIGLIAVCKMACFAITYAKRRYNAVAEAHTLLNKVTGLLLFLLPFTFCWLPAWIPVCVVCVAASLAAADDVLILKRLNKKTT